MGVKHTHLGSCVTEETVYKDEACTRKVLVGRKFWYMWRYPDEISKKKIYIFFNLEELNTEPESQLFPLLLGGNERNQSNKLSGLYLHYNRLSAETDWKE